MSIIKNNGHTDQRVIHWNSNDFNRQTLTPVSNWDQTNDLDHFVQFYETDDFLLNSLCDFINKGLGAGDACIVVATKSHRHSLDERIRASGIDLEAVQASGQYVSLDAAETLAKFMIDGSPEPERFTQLVGEIIARAAQGRRHVRIFGEMVALLWTQGKYDAAIRLEELWNELHKYQDFSLFCAYPINSFDGEELAQPLCDVCTAHSYVIPAESYTRLDTTDDRLRAISLLQQKANSLETEIAERKEAERALRAMKDQLEAQVIENARLHCQVQQELEKCEQLLIREQLARAEAERANRLKDEFLATISHELRTPLSAIIGWCSMLRGGRLDQPMIARALETIERNAKSQAQLVEDILDVSRIIRGKIHLNIEVVDLATVINAAIDSVQLAADSKGIQLEVRFDPSARHISGDAGRLQQVVWNLLSNAIKFTPSGGRVEVRLERVNSEIQIAVKDTGQGIHPDFLPFIFDRFRQADATTTRQYGGLGLGLAIVRHMIELHGGTVHADSPGEGQGATLTVKFPASADRSESRKTAQGSIDTDEPANPQSAPHHALEGVHVLLVDDNVDSLHILRIVLGEHQADIQIATSVAEALEVLKWYEADILVSDLAMPGEDGYALIKKLRAQEAESGKHIPAVALTAYVRVEDRARALSAGFDMFVPKPVEPSELIEAITSLIEPGLKRSKI